MKRNFFLTFVLLLLALPLASCGNDNEPNMDVIFGNTLLSLLEDEVSFSQGTQEAVEVHVNYVNDQLVCFSPTSFTIDGHDYSGMWFYARRSDLPGSVLKGATIMIKIKKFKVIDLTALGNKIFPSSDLRPAYIQMAVLCVIEPYNE